MYCNKCGKQIPNNSKFCNNCGNKIDNEDSGSLFEKNNNQPIVSKQNGHGCIITLLFIIALPTIIGILLFLLIFLL